MWDNPKRIEAAITRLTREIEQIDKLFYRVDDDERHLYVAILQRKRDDMVRGIVLQIHTSIEDLLDQHITFAIIGSTRRNRRRSHSARALRTILVGTGSLGFDKKLSLALALRVITKKTKDRLQILNTLRNKCSHNWILKVPVRHGRRPAQTKPPLLTYEGRDLHNIATMEDFIAEYGGRIYLRLFMKYLDLD